MAGRAIGCHIARTVSEHKKPTRFFAAVQPLEFFRFGEFAGWLIET
jgi:hypothetical protein